MPTFIFSFFFFFWPFSFLSLFLFGPIVKSDRTTLSVRILKYQNFLPLFKLLETLFFHQN